MKKIYILFFAALILSSCVNDNQSYIEELEKKIEEYEAKEVANNKLKTDFCAQLETFGNIQDSIRMYVARIDSLKAVIKTKRKASNEDNAALNNMLAQIDSYLAKNKELASTLNTKDFRGKDEKQIIALLLQTIEDKEQQIASMKAEIEDLNNQVAGLQVANRTLTASLSKSQDAINDRDNVIDAQNRELSSLTLSNLAVIFPKGLLGNDRKAKKIDYLGFGFTLNKNSRANNQSVTIYVRVTNASGQLLRSSDNNLFDSEEGRIGYTVKKNINYNGATVNDCIDWNMSKGTLQSGEYIATFYMDSRKIDQKTFSLK